MFYFLTLEIKDSLISKGEETEFKTEERQMQSQDYQQATDISLRVSSEDNEKRQPLQRKQGAKPW
jgi:hypothetical protein